MTKYLNDPCSWQRQHAYNNHIATSSCSPVWVMHACNYYCHTHTIHVSGVSYHILYIWASLLPCTYRIVGTCGSVHACTCTPWTMHMQQHFLVCPVAAVNSCMVHSYRTVKLWRSWSMRPITWHALFTQTFGVEGGSSVKVLLKLPSSSLFQICLCYIHEH